MREITILVANFCIGISFRYLINEKKLQDYLTDKKPEYFVNISEDDIALEREKYIKEAEAEGKKDALCSEASLEFTAILRKIGDYIYNRNAVIFHGVLLQKGNDGYLFTAKSQTGKTTHAGLWLKEFEDAFIVNGDKPILRYGDGEITGYGTPWCGKEGYQKNCSVNVKAVVIVERADTNSIVKITGSEAFPMILQQTHKPSGVAGMKNTLKFADELLSSIPIYRLRCNMEPEAAHVAFNGLTGGEV